MLIKIERSTLVLMLVDFFKNSTNIVVRILQINKNIQLKVFIIEICQLIILFSDTIVVEKVKCIHNGITRL